VQVGVVIEVGEDGLAQVNRTPTISDLSIENNAKMGLVDVPAEVAAGIDVDGEVLGGRRGPDGWELVVIATGRDGVSRPVTVRP
jgi:hypothetical protein